MKQLFIPISIIIAGAIIAGAVVYTAETKKSQVGTTEEQPTRRQPQLEEVIEFKITKDDNVRGDLEAPITIVEYSDFQCPFCQRFHQTLQQITADYPDQIRWVYKHFPLDSIHPQARPAAEASECAAEQGKFWEFADGLMENQSKLGKDLYRELAGNLGLNMSDFNDCVASREYEDKVERDYQGGIKAGVTGTPGSFVNGELISGSVPYETLKAAIERAIAEE